jgi:hypothetical protein
MSQIGKKYNRHEALRPSTDSSEAREAEEADTESIATHHVISKSQNIPVSLFNFVQTNSKDPAIKVGEFSLCSTYQPELITSLQDFISKLRDHLLGQVCGHDLDCETHQSFSDDEKNSIRIRNNTIYRVSTLRVNYTTYDMRRDFDTINSKAHPFIMVPSPETEQGAHPFWYAAVLGVFHADVQHVGNESRDFRFKRMEFLWVRWLGVVPGYAFGKKQAKLPKIGFVPDSDEFAFGFLDPSHVIRGCHLIPSFVDGKTQDLLMTDSGVSLGRIDTEKDDWSNYTVGM